MSAYDDRPRLRGHYAGFASRLVAFVIDSVTISVAVAFSTWASALIAASLEGLIAVNILDYIPDYTYHLSGWTGALSVLLTAFYHIFFLATAGRTPGKSFMGLRVLTEEGERLSVWRATVRQFGYYLSALPLVLGFAWVLLDDRRQGWHDKLARTFVVYSWDARPDERFLARHIRRFARGASSSAPPE